MTISHTYKLGNTNIKSENVVPWLPEEELEKEAALQYQPVAEQIAAAEQHSEEQ